MRVVRLTLATAHSIHKTLKGKTSHLLCVGKTVQDYF